MKKTFKGIGRFCFLLIKPDLKMKLTYFFLVVSFLQISAKSYGQNAKVTLELENVTIEKAFERIEALTDYSFLYSIKSVNLERRVSISSYKQPINKVLRQLFKSTNITFLIKDRQIVLTVLQNKNITTNRRTAGRATIQNEISGRVTDENNMPLPGVTILISGTQKGVVTDFDGAYTIKAAKGQLLIFNYLGYLDMEILVGDTLIYDVKMIPTTFDLEGVDVVFTGYQKIAKERATGSFGKVKENLLELKVNQNILDKITDEVPGILFSEDDGIIVRGLSSINANTQPLIVIDGLPTELSVTDINPNDVANITILRDAAAASIWGIRAANGVIVIVSKKGSRDEKIAIEATVNTGITGKQDIFDNNLGGAATQIAYQRALFEAQNDSYSEIELFSGDGTLSPREFFQLDPVIETLLLHQRGDLSESQVSERLSQYEQRDARREYSDRILRNPIWNQYNVSVSGGSEKQDYRASLTYNKNQFNTVSNSSEQFIANFRNSIDFSDKLKARFTVNFSNTNQVAPPTEPEDRLELVFAGNTPEGFLGNIPFTSALLNAQGGYNPLVGGANQAYSDFLVQQGGPYPFTYNILQEFDNANNEVDRLGLRLQAGLDYKIVKNLELQLNYQYEWGSTTLRNLYNEATFATRSRVNLFSEVNRTNSTVGDLALPQGSILDQSFGTQTAHSFRGQLSYQGNFNDGLHRINAIAGYEARKTLVEVNYKKSYGYDDQTLLFTEPDYTTNFRNFYSEVFLSSNQRIPTAEESDFVENRFLSYFANIAYTFSDNYTLSASTRLDDTNLFGASKEFRNVPLYSFGAKWNVANTFFPLSETVNRLQLRGSFGINGNVDRSAGPFLQANIFQQNQAYTNRAATISNLPNPLLRLEKTNTTNFGIDFGIFNDLLNGSVEYYFKNSEDLLADVNLNPTLGVSQFLLNAGELTNQGIDINLNLNLGSLDKLAYIATFNFSFNKNKLTKVDIDQDRISSYINGSATIEGNALSTIYSYRYANLDRNGAPQFFNRDNQILNFNFTNPAISSSNFTTEDLKKEGTLIPVYYGAWINNFAYKNLSLRVLTNFRAGHVFRYPTAGNFQTFVPRGREGIVNVAQDFNQRWQNPGDETQTTIPAIPNATNTLADGYRNYPLTDKFVDDASHIRLSQISLNYAFSALHLKNTGMSGLSMGLQFDNVAVWNFNKWDVDPENTLIPRPATITLNLNASF